MDDIQMLRRFVFADAGIGAMERYLTYLQFVSAVSDDSNEYSAFFQDFYVETKPCGGGIKRIWFSWNLNRGISIRMD